MLRHLPPSSCRARCREVDGGAALGAMALEGPSGARADPERRGAIPWEHSQSQQGPRSRFLHAVGAGELEPARKKLPRCWPRGSAASGTCRRSPCGPGDQLPPGGAFWHGWWQGVVAGGSALSKNLVVPALAGFWTAPWEGEKSLLQAQAFSRISAPSLSQRLHSQGWVQSRELQRYL